MEEKYINYVKKFNELDISEKREYIINNLEELMKVFGKINIDFGKEFKFLPVTDDYETEEEFLTNIFTHILSLKEISAETINIIAEKFYRED